MGIIYCARNRLNGKRYIGQTIFSLDFRKRQHENDARIERTNGCRLFISALRKYGFDAFEWTIIFDSVEEGDLNAFEIDAISVYRTLVPNGYNLKEGGANGSPSKITRKLLSEAGKGRKHTEESKEKMRQAAKNRSPETRKKLSESTKGYVKSPEHREKIRQAALKRPYRCLTEEHKQKLRKPKSKKTKIES